LASVFDTLFKFVEPFLFSPDRDIHIRPGLSFPIVVFDELLDALAFTLSIFLKIFQFLLISSAQGSSSTRLRR
jgi:hypothetical protein